MQGRLFGTAFTRFFSGLFPAGFLSVFRFEIEVLRNLLKPKVPRSQLTLAQVLKTCSDYYGISVDALQSKVRTKQVAHARQMAMYICRENTQASLSQIGLRWNLDHLEYIKNQVAELRIDFRLLQPVRLLNFTNLGVILSYYNNRDSGEYGRRACDDRGDDLLLRPSEIEPCAY